MWSRLLYCLNLGSLLFLLDILGFLSFIFSIQLHASTQTCTRQWTLKTIKLFEYWVIWMLPLSSERPSFILHDRHSRTITSQTISSDSLIWASMGMTAAFLPRTTIKVHLTCSLNSESTQLCTWQLWHCYNKQCADAAEKAVDSWADRKRVCNWAVISTRCRLWDSDCHLDEGFWNGA